MRPPGRAGYAAGGRDVALAVPLGTDIGGDSDDLCALAMVLG